MKPPPHFHTSRWPVWAARAGALFAASLTLGSPAAHALEIRNQFDVMISLASAATRAQTGSCAPAPAPATTPTLVCGSRLTSALTSTIASSAVSSSRLGGGYRFISYASGLPAALDIYTGAGTSTAFRLVNWADRDYIEMTVGW